MEAEEVIWGRNPVLEALRARRRIRRLVVAQGVHAHGSLAEAVQLARASGVPVQRVPREALDRMCGTPHHQGIAILTAPRGYVDLDSILEGARRRGEMPFLLVLDSLQDPQNLGSLLRTSDAAGVHGIVIPKHRSVGLTGAVAKVSAGAVEHVPTAQVTNLARTLDELKQHGLWMVGLDMAAAQEYHEVDLNIPLALVVGSEGKGLGRLVKEKCDLLVRLPMRGKVDSLNAAVAGAIVLYEVLRQRSRKGETGVGMRH